MGLAQICGGGGLAGHARPWRLLAQALEATRDCGQRGLKRAAAALVSEETDSSRSMAMEKAPAGVHGDGVGGNRPERAERNAGRCRGPNPAREARIGARCRGSGEAGGLATRKVEEAEAPWQWNNCGGGAWGTGGRRGRRGRARSTRAPEASAPWFEAEARRGTWRGQSQGGTRSEARGRRRRWRVGAGRRRSQDDGAASDGAVRRAPAEQRRGGRG